MASEIYDVIILGAGISGLSTAHQILTDRPGTSVFVLEAKEKCGGRINSYHLDSGDPTELHIKVDLGASFVHGITGNPLTELSKEVPFKLHLPSEDSIPYIYNFSGELLPSKEAERLFYLSHSVTFERLHSLSQSSSEIPETSSIYSALEGSEAGKGVWSGIEENERRTLMDISQQWSGWTGASLDKVSLKYWGFEQEYHGQDAVVKDGYESLIDFYHREIEKLGAKIKLNTVVGKVSNQGQDDFISVNDHWKSHFLICSFPLGVLKQFQFNPSLPERRLSSIRRLGMGLLNKLVLQYPNHWWPSPCDSEGWIMLLPSSEWSPLIEEYRKDSKTKQTTSKETSLEMLKNGPVLLQDYHLINNSNVLVAFFGPPLAEILESLSDAESSRVIHDRLLSTIGPHSNPDSDLKIEPPSKVIVTRWNSDPFSRGSYTFLPCSSAEKNHEVEGASPLDIMECSHPLWNGKLRFVGEHTDPDCYASVHGALLSGRREGKRVADLLGVAGRALVM